MAHKSWKGAYAYNQLLQKHSLDETGEWEIYGEDPNCDFGGHHHQPFLGIASGRLGDVIAYAEGLPGFWQWGAGGEIKKLVKPGVHIVPEGFADQYIDPNEEKRQELKAQIEQLQAELKRLD